MSRENLKLWRWITREVGTNRDQSEVPVVVVVDGGVDGDGLGHIGRHVDRGRGPDTVTSRGRVQHSSTRFPPARLEDGDDGSLAGTVGCVYHGLDNAPSCVYKPEERRVKNGENKKCTKNTKYDFQLQYGRGRCDLPVVDLKDCEACVLGEGSLLVF